MAPSERYIVVANVKDNSEADTTSFFESVQQSTLLTELERMYANLTGLALITAAPGAGVTAAIEHFCATLPANNGKLTGINTAIIDAADNTVAGFLAEILAAFGYEIEDARQSELFSLTTMICEHQAIAGRPPLIAIEHVDLAKPKILALINQLAGIRHRQQAVCRLVLTGGENLLDIAKAERMGEVSKRVCAELTLGAMDLTELKAFTAHALAERRLHADERAIDSLVRLSNGLPGEIIRAIEYASGQSDTALSSGDMLLALESALPPAEHAVAPTDTTQIQEITLQNTQSFNEGQPQDDAVRSKSPLGEILVNRNGELLSRHVIKRRKVLIGRAPHNDIVLESRWVSRHHAILVCGPDKATLADVNSTNGLTLNSRELRQGNLRHNDIIVIGDFRLKYVNENASRRNSDDLAEQTETRVLRSLSVADLNEVSEQEDKTQQRSDEG